MNNWVKRLNKAAVAGVFKSEIYFKLSKYLSVTAFEFIWPNNNFWTPLPYVEKEPHHTSLILFGYDIVHPGFIF